MAGFEQDSLIEELKKQKVDLYSILAVCLLTDGSMQVKNNSFRLAYASQDRRLLSILWSLMNELSDYLPIVTGFQIFTIRLSDKELGEKLAGLCPNYKTSPVHYEKINDYLATPSHHYRFWKPQICEPRGGQSGLGFLQTDVSAFQNITSQK